MHGGFLQVRPDESYGTKVVILADGAARAEDIDEGAAEEAKAKAEQAMREYVAGDTEKYEMAHAQYEQAIAMLRVAHRKRRGGGQA